MNLYIISIPKGQIVQLQNVSATDFNVGGWQVISDYPACGSSSNWVDGTRRENELDMTDTKLASDLLRAANSVDTLSPSHVTRLLDRAIQSVQDIRNRVGIVPIRNRDSLIDIRTVAAGADRVPLEEWQHALLHAAEMLRDLHIVVDSGTKIKSIEN